MIIEVESDICNVTFPVPGVYNNAQCDVRIVDVHIPDPPLLGAYLAAVDGLDIPPSRNMYDLVDTLDALLDGADRLIKAYWNGTEFEIIAVFKQLTLSGDFASVLKLPTTLVLNQVYSSCINVAAVDVSAGTCVELFLGEMDGFYSGDQTADVVRLKRGQSEPPLMWHRTRVPALSGSIRVYSIERATGNREILRMREGERWSARVELKMRTHGFPSGSAF